MVPFSTSDILIDIDLLRNEFVLLGEVFIIRNRSIKPKVEEGFEFFLKFSFLVLQVLNGCPML